MIGDLTVGSAALLGVGVAARPGTGPVTIIGEIEGELGGSEQAEMPIEVRTGARWTHRKGLSVAAAYGRGLTHGYGAPDNRFMLSVGFRSPDPAPPAAPPRIEVAEAPKPAPDPDPDRDGIIGEADNCPDKAEDVDGYEDTDGCPEADNDGDGMADADDGCPIHAEDADGFQDDDGCPEPDNDGDGLADANDSCANDPEIINGVEDEDGCPDEGKQLVVVGTTKIEIREMIHFAHDQDVVLPKSEPVLAQLATNLKRNPWLLKVSIEGHTDDRADDAHNLDLSKRRAEAVRRALIERGIDANRLQSKGLGEAHPIDTNKTAAGRANNRRVEFIILEHDEKHPGAVRAREKGAVK